MTRNICQNIDSILCLNHSEVVEPIVHNGLHNEDLDLGKTRNHHELQLDPKRLEKKNKKKKNDQKHEITEHLMSIQELCDKLQTNSETGLSENEAQLRLKRYGLNAFTPPKQTFWLLLYFKEMIGMFALLLWFSSIASFVVYFIDKDITDFYLGLVLALTVILTGSFSYYQQASSSKVFKSFKDMTPPQTQVIRDGKRRLIPADQIVIGDLVYCKTGDRIPADIRITRNESMKVDNSSLTGEADPLSRTQDIVNESALEARNLAFFSTNCVDGSGYGIAIATGDNTVMGDIAKIVSQIENKKTPIAKEIDRFVKIIAVISVGSGLVFFFIEKFGFSCQFYQAFILMIGITVGNVPEGLLPALTVTLTLTAKRMASKNCLVKHLEAVETLGSTSTICTDKTGTLTQNRMTVEHCWLGRKTYKISHDKQELHLQMNPIKNCWESYRRCAILCSKSEFIDQNQDIMERVCSGDASETAILRFMESVAGPVTEYREMYPKVAEKPFSSTNKYQYSIHKNSDINIAGSSSSAHFFLVMKGAPERIIKLCSTAITADGQTVKIDDDLMNEFEQTYEELGSNGERVLAMCDYDFTQFSLDYEFNLEDGNNFELKNFRFLGLISMIDPPRPSVPSAVAKCRSAGIKIIMVTGDHPTTAKAIAKSVGIISVPQENSTNITIPTIDEIVSRSIVIAGHELSELTDEKLKEILDGYEEIVFARTSPQQKLRIVKNCQDLGQIVAVTGDGVNDSPALKKADIGIAMGISGSEVSKEAADLILLDDNFATIVIGVEEGRKIFDNMKKTISYILAGNVTTVYPFVAYVLFGFPLPIGTINILLISLGTDMIPAISLAYERSESDIMNLPPRNSKTDKLVNSQLLLRAYLLIGAIETAAGFYAYFIALNYEGFKPKMLWQLRTEWESNNIVYKYGPYDDWNGDPKTPTTYEERQQLQNIAQSSYFIGIVIVQWIDVIVCKTRRISIFKQGMNNWVLNFGIVFETCLAILFCYTPGLNTALKTAPVIGQIPLTAIPFFLYILIFEEMRKMIIRKYPNSFLGKQLLA